MLVRPALQALRTAQPAQRQGPDAIAAERRAWLGSELGQRSAAELSAFSAGQPIEDLPLLSCLFAPDEAGHDAARRFVDGQLAPLLRSLAAAPLSQAPLGFAHEPCGTTLVLARQDTTVLSLHLICRERLAARAEPQSIGLIPAETHERVVAGQAAGTLIRVAGPLTEQVSLTASPVVLHSGDVGFRRGWEEVLILNEVPATAVLLRLQRRTSPSAIAREYRIADGRLLHQAAGSPNDSRLELAANLLGRMGRNDAAPLLAAMAEETGSASLRWQALRECLALDTSTGFAALCRIARSSQDELAAPAGALRAQLIEAIPQLTEADPCRA